MIGLNNLTVLPADRAHYSNPLEQSQFNLFPEEMILEVFKRVLVTDRVNLRGVCTTFKNLADDHSLLRDEINSVKATLAKIVVSRADRESIEEEMGLIGQASNGAQLKLFELLAIFKRLLPELPKENLANLSVDSVLMEDAPLFANYFKKLYRECWKAHLQQELETRHKSIRLNHEFSPEIFPLFLEALNGIDGEIELELDFSVSVNQARLYAGAIENGLLSAEEISLIGHPQINTEKLGIYLSGIGNSNHIKKLRLLDCSLYANEFTIIENSLKNNSSLRSISINDFAFSEESLQTFSTLLTENQGITDLELWRCSGAEMVGLLSNLNQTNMQKLSFHRSMLNFGTIDRLAEILPTLEKVQVLDLQHNELSDEEIENLQSVIRQNGLNLDMQLPQKKVYISRYFR